MDQTSQIPYDPDIVSQLYKRVVWIYDIWSRLTEEQALQTILRWADIQDGQNLLEAGVGTGRLFSRLIPNNKTGKNIGIDLSDAMLEKSRKKCSGLSNKQLLKADITALPDNLGNFDRIISSYVLDLLPASLYPAILNRFRSMLKPDGSLIIAYMEAGESPAHRFWNWIAITFPRLMTHCRPIDLKTYLREAGFVIVRNKSLTQLTFPSCVIEAKI